MGFKVNVRANPQDRLVRVRGQRQPRCENGVMIEQILHNLQHALMIGLIGGVLLIVWDIVDPIPDDFKAIKKGKRK